jgi:lipopolysaccharide export system permease protein
MRGLLWLLPRSVLWDLVKVFGLSLGALSGVLMLGGAMVEAGRHGLDPMDVAAMVPYLIPPTLPFTIPACLLLACTLVYGRMSANTEIVALKASGVSAWQVIWPAAALATFLAGLGIYLTNSFIPQCNRAIARTVVADVQSNLLAYLDLTGQLVEPDIPYEIYIRDVRGQRLVGPIFKHRDGAGNYDVMIQAEEAWLEVVEIPNALGVDFALDLKMINGAVTSPGGSTIHFRSQTQRIPMPATARREAEDVRQLDYSGCLAHSRRRLAEAKRHDYDLAMLFFDSAVTGGYHDFLNQVTHNRNMAKRSARKSREAAAQVHLRVAQSTVALPFILLGCPISILFQRRDFLQSFFVCYLPIVTVYYPAMIFSYNLVKEGAGHVVVNLWTPIAVMTIIAVPLLRRVLRH